MLSLVITSCRGISCVIIRRSTFLADSSIGNIKTIPGPIVLAYLPSRKITSRSYSRAILSPEAITQQANIITPATMPIQPPIPNCNIIIFTPFH
ncbi:hypothetical protein DSAG12_04470 [Promethearchaeum syntrophicum]|uniref:Uncharacterized protein n=1 Tax=Promethearchaeum syntrophicum TaxID=2594042 RepID=A0AC61ZU38_9ARCH|nr:hypothetical protein [Candidatus Prometheoarchaeum syntrophicum]